MTEPFSGGEIETCTACHGGGRGYAPDKVSTVANPYKPPYVGEPQYRQPTSSKAVPRIRPRL